MVVGVSNSSSSSSSSSENITSNSSTDSTRQPSSRGRGAARDGSEITPCAVVQSSGSSFWFLVGSKEIYYNREYIG